MNKQTFSSWVGMVAVVLVLGVLLSFASPFAGSIRDSVSTWIDDFSYIAEDAMTVKYSVKLTVDTADAGTVTFTGEYSGTDLNLKGEKTLTATATVNDGYRFLGWYDGDELLSTETEYEFTVSQAKTITARYKALTAYTVTLDTNTVGAGTVVFTGSYSGTSVSLLGDHEITAVATVNNGYRFLGWYNGETLLSTDLTYTFTVSDAATFTAKYEQLPFYAVTLSSDTAAAGSVSFVGEHSGASLCLRGENTLMAVATVNSGYTFLGWYNGDELLSTSALYTFTVTGAIALTAKYASA